MHNYKKISLNILLILSTILSSILGVFWLGTIKNRSLAESTRYTEFLYSGQNDSRVAYNYEYDKSTGWGYSYGYWDETLNIKFNVTEYTGDTSTVYTAIKENDKLVIKKNSGYFDLLLTLNSNSKPCYNGAQVWENDVTNVSTDESTGKNYIKIGSTPYEIKEFTSDSTITQYIVYPQSMLYVKNVGADSNGQDTYKLYIDPAFKREYVGNGSGEYDESGNFTKIAYPTNPYTVENKTTYSWTNEDTKRVYPNANVNSDDNFALKNNNSSNVVILENYLNNLSIKDATTAPTTDPTEVVTKGINNFYVEFNKAVPYDSANNTIDKDHNTIITSLNVTAYIKNNELSNLQSGANTHSEYGVRIKINPTASQTNLKFDDNHGGYVNNYWFDYFDLTNISYLTNNNDSVPLKNAYGLYTIVFDYTVLDYDSSTQGTTSTKESYVYYFYLTDDAKYVEYPTLNHTAQGKSEYYEEKEYSTTFFNMDTYNLPTYLFDASKYNITYKHTSPDDISKTYATSFRLFSKDGYDEKLGLLTLGDESYVIVLDKTNRKITYYKGGENVELVDANKYGEMTISEDGKYLLKLSNIKKYENGMLLKQGATDTPISYYFPIVLDSLGEYEFTNKYMVENSAYTFITVDSYEKKSADGTTTTTINLAKNIFKNMQIVVDASTKYCHENVLTQMKYENGNLVLNNGKSFSAIEKPTASSSSVLKDNDYNESRDGGYNLVFLGTKSTFMKNKTTSPFRDLANGVYADITGNSTLRLDPKAYSTLTKLGIKYGEIPVTNLSPILFDTYGMLSSNSDNLKVYRWNKNLTKNPSNNGYYIDADGFYNIKGDSTYVSNFTNGTSCERSGLYYIIVKSTYNGLSSETYPEATATQYFLFEIDNSDPELYFYTDPANKKPLSSTTKYTNSEKLYFTWAEPNYFQEEITALVSYSDSYDENRLNSTKVAYTKDTLISTSTGSALSPEGMYHFYLYYGPKPLVGDEYNRYCKEPRIYIDRTNPEADLYANKVIINSDGSQENKYVSTNGVKIVNGEFKFFAKNKKASGAEVVARYAEINFDTTLERAKVYSDIMVSTATSFTFVNDKSISFQLYNLNAKSEADLNNNLTLGSTNSATSSKLYILLLTDDAGNEVKYYYIFDNSTPRAVIQQLDSTDWKEVDLESSKISKDTRVFWGSEKGIKYNEQTGILYSELSTAFKYIEDHSASEYMGFVIKTYSGEKFITLPLANIAVTDSNNPTNRFATSQTKQITIVTKSSKSDLYNDATIWTQKLGTPITLESFVSQNKQSYNTTISDVLDNKSIQYTLYLDTDLSQLTIFPNDIVYGKDAIVDSSAGKNTMSISVDKIVPYFTSDIAENIVPVVTYTYYPFALSEYISDNPTKTSEKVFSSETITTINNKNISPLYPFSKSPFITDANVTSGISLNTYMSNGKEYSQEGLYILKRVYKNNLTGEQLTDAEVKELSENDEAILYMYIVVDRQDIISLSTDNTGNVSMAESIGDLITFTLGNGTNDSLLLDAGTLNILKNSSGEAQPIFTTNRVKVSTYVPVDKYATPQKLLDEDITVYNKDTDWGENKSGIEKAIDKNKTLFGLYVSLYRDSVDSKPNYLVHSNNLTDAGKIVIARSQSFEQIKDGEISLNTLLSLVQNGKYTLEISDKGLDDNGQAQYANKTSFVYQISHKPPSGKYVSYYNDASNTKYDLSVQVSNEYKSVNKDALSFEFEDYDNKYHARIDENHFEVSRSTSKTGSYETILKRENGVYTVSPNWDSATLQGLSKEQYISQYVFDIQQINSATKEEDKLYRYTIHIFNDYDANHPLISERDKDYFYRVTIYYKGESSFYEIDNDNFYFATYSIHQDIIAPSQNLNRLKEIARPYAGDIDEKNYFFAIDKNADSPIIRPDFDETNEIYLRKFDSLSAFVPSLLPGDENYGSLSTSAPSFNPISVDVSKYTLYSYNPYEPYDIDFSGVENGYYELIELDLAQNITRYFVYISDNSTGFVNIEFDSSCNQTEPETHKLFDYTDFDINKYNSTLSQEVAKLRSIENFIYIDGEIIMIDKDNYATSQSDYYVIEDEENNTKYYYYFDKFINVYIKDETGNTVKTIVCDPFSESLNEFFARVVDEFDAIQAENKAFTYSIEVLNRFGENYSIKLLLPGSQLELTITDRNGYFEVEVPGQSGNVYLTQFIPKRGNGNVVSELAQDSQGVAINKLSDTGLTNAKYRFGDGAYNFTIVDNYGRSSTIYKYFGGVTDEKYTFSFGEPNITKNDSDYGDITYTNKNVTLNINKELWNIAFYYGKDLKTLKENHNKPERATNVTESRRADSKGKYTYTFTETGYYYVEISWSISDTNPEVYSYAFCIDDTLPKVYALFDSGTQRELSNDSYSENITITWVSDYDVTGTVEFTNANGTVTTTTITKDINDFYVDKDGTYKITLVDAIGNSITRVFEKIASSYAYFTVSADDRPLKVSDYSSQSNDGNTILYYYVSYDENSLVRPAIKVLPDSSKGITYEQTEWAFDDEVNTGNNQYNQYTISSSSKINGTEEQFTICIIRVVFVNMSSDFAEWSITEKIDKDGKNVEHPLNSEMTNAKLLTLSYNAINYSGNDGNPDVYSGNTTYLLHYLNGTLIETIYSDIKSEQMTLYIMRAGLHRFEIRDLCGNVQEFNGKDYLELYVVNSIIYTINDNLPIDNCFYNDEVKLKIVDTLGSEKIYEASIAVMYNGKALEGVSVDADGYYVFATPGYYTVTLTGQVSETISLTKTFSFTIINQNVAMIAFNIPTSYGFTIKSIYKNQANMSDLIENPSTLWLSAGDTTFGAGVFTINASYFDPSLKIAFDFSFKVWINEETPTILPKNYTYGTKTSKVITIQFNSAIIYSQIGEGYILITNEKGSTVNTIEINSESENVVKEINFNATGVYTVGLYNKEGKLVSSYKVIKTTPLNSSAKIIIIIVSSVVVVLIGIFIFLRKKLRFR